MKKYLLFIAFTFLGICFAQDLSIEEQLKLLGADDFFVKDVKAQSDTDTAQTTQDGEDSQRADSLNIADNAHGQSDSAHANSGASSETGRHRQPASSISSPMPAGFGQGRPGGSDTAQNLPQISVFDTAVVAQERTIDFSRNLSQYRSPQKALLYSLLLPGLGQAYNKNYWRTGLYAAIEAGMITGAIYFKRDANKIRKDAENLTDSDFDKNKLEEFYKEITEYGYKKFPENTEDTANSINVGYYIFGTGGIFSDDSVKFAYQKYMELFDEDFYGNTGNFYAVQGWSDAFFTDYDIDTAGAPPYVTVNGNRGFGISQKQNRFNSLVNKSGIQGRRSSAFVVGMFANHIASAMDAFLSTIIHNRKLLRDEEGETPTKAQDILSRISIDGDMYLNGDGALTSKLGFVWRF